MRSSRGDAACAHTGLAAKGLAASCLACALAGVALLTAAPEAARAEGLTSLKAGLLGVATFPADPVMMAIDPPEEFEVLPGSVVLGRIGGLVAGTLMGGYRLLTGVYDIALFPLWIVPVMSPEPRWGGEWLGEDDEDDDW